MLNLWATRASAGLLLSSLLVFGGCRWQARLDAGALQAANVRADKAEAAIQRIAELTRQAADKARTASERVKRDAQAADERLEDKTHEAQRTAADLAAALRTGDRRLRDLWACRAAGPAEGGDPADAGQADAERRADGAGHIAGAVAADAAVIGWLYDRWQAEHRAVIAAGCAVEGE